MINAYKDYTNYKRKLGWKCIFTETKTTIVVEEYINRINNIKVVKIYHEIKKLKTSLREYNNIQV